MHSYRYQLLPEIFHNFYSFKCDFSKERAHNTTGNFIVPKNTAAPHIKFPHIEAVLDWNLLPPHIKSLRKPSKFKKAVLDHLIGKYEEDCTITNCYICK